eukprot:4057728-Ditylum_brightwellii.AAC.1
MKYSKNWLPPCVLPKLLLSNRFCMKWGRSSLVMVPVKMCLPAEPAPKGLRSGSSPGERHCFQKEAGYGIIQEEPRCVSGW